MAAVEPKDDFGGVSFLLFCHVLFVPLGLVAILGGLEGASLYAPVIKYVVAPASVVLAALLAWLWWRHIRGKGFTYVDKEGDTVQDEPWVAALRCVFLAAIFSVVLWFGLQAVLRCVVKAMPGTPVTFQTHITRLGSGRGCRVSVEYADTITSGTVRICSEIASGRRWIGEPITAHESAGLLGTKLDHLTFDDAQSHNEDRLGLPAQVPTMTVSLPAPHVAWGRLTPANASDEAKGPSAFDPSRTSTGSAK